MELTFLVFGVLVVCLAMGVPIAFSLGIATLVGLFLTDIPLIFLGQTAYTGCDLFPLLAVPAFILAGYIMEKGAVSEKITNIASELVGHFPGGLAIVTIISCMFFASVSGSGPATVAAVGSIMIPAMKKQGYSLDFAAAVASSGGTLGILIPPSNPMIIYGVVGNVSIAALFIGGIIPGLLVGLVMAFVAYIISKKRGYRGTAREFSLKRLMRSINEGKWALLAPVIILGGIYGGL
ncbi:MAG: TRAP transporter large permease subunit, partial [Desulfobacteraceae bacterium]|nr:TRAP transporter large permease subunit [Desulfobacteraceae bacterium]